MKQQLVSKQTQKNWWIDATLFSGAVISALSGIYFLFLPTGGFQGGRNPFYDIRILFTRQTWENVHTWGGVVMIAAVIIHLAVHWSWVTSMARRTWHELTGKGSSLNSKGRWNLVLNSVVATSFLLVAISGIYFLFVPGGRWAADPMFIFSKTTWDLIHTWSSVLLIVAAILHFAIHWKWVTKVTQKMARLIFPGRSVTRPTTPSSCPDSQ